MLGGCSSSKDMRIDARLGQGSDTCEGQRWNAGSLETSSYKLVVAGLLLSTVFVQLVNPSGSWMNQKLHGGLGGRRGSGYRVCWFLVVALLRFIHALRMTNQEW